MRDVRSSVLALALAGCAAGGFGSPATAQGLQDRLEQVFGPPRDRTETGRSPVASRPLPSEATATDAASPEAVPLPSERPETPAGDAESARETAPRAEENRAAETEAAAPEETPGAGAEIDPPAGQTAAGTEIASPETVGSPAVPEPRPDPARDDQAEPDGAPDRDAPQADAPDPGEPEASPSEASDGADAQEGSAPVEAEPAPAYEPPAEARTRPEASAPETPPIAVSPEASVAAAAAIEDARLCEAELERRGAVFRTEPTFSEAACGVLRPVVIETLSNGLAVEPDTMMLCRTALSLDIWASEGVMAAAERDLGEAPVTLRQSSTFVCRDRASESGLSEHARGSAIDIAAFLFAEREEIAVREHAAGSAEDRFLAEVRRSACGPFRTVIGPGTDADHSDHFHLDIAVRRNDSLYCR